MGKRESKQEHPFLYALNEGHLVVKDPTCQRGQMRIHMHPQDYEAFLNSSQNGKEG